MPSQHNLGADGHVEADSPEQPDEAGMPAPAGCIQAFLGLVIGGLVGFVLVCADPFGVLAFPLPQGADARQVEAAYAQWKSSVGVIAGQFATYLIPLLVSGLCGVFAHASPPASIPAALLRAVGVASLLSIVLWVGEPVVERALGTGGSSDIQGGLAGMAFTFLCFSLSAPLTSAVTARRSAGKKSLPVDEGMRLG